MTSKKSGMESTALRKNNRATRHTFRVLILCGLLALVLIPSHLANSILSNFLARILPPVSQCWSPSTSKALSQQSQWSFTDLEQFLVSEPSATRMEEWSRYYTSTEHFNGQGEEQGTWTQRKWEEFGIPETKIYPCDALVGSPVGQHLTLLDTAAGPNDSPELLYTAKLMEDMPAADDSKIRTPAYLGGSVSGNVTARYVFVNYGLQEDYDDLEKAGVVDLEGKIAVARYGQRGRVEKIKLAAKKGLVGIILYTDPGEDGKYTEGNGYKAYPDGPARPETYIERGVGNVLRQTEGNTSDSYSSSEDETIPCLTSSYGDIVPILSALNGHGPNAEDLGDRWQRGGLAYRGVQYSIGPSPPGLELNLVNMMEYSHKQLFNVLGTITGSSPDDIIIIGNHRDAWTAGASDPNSGSAALMEVVRSFGSAYKAGWRPRRTLIFVSFEGEEIGEIGSSAWVLENLPWISNATVAYLNVVVAASGQTFHAKASPLLSSIVRRAANTVSSPSQDIREDNKTVLDRWGGGIKTPGGGDALTFLQTACIPTIDIGFSPGKTEPFFPYHSNFDTFHWMKTTGDPGWNHHLATTRIWSLMAAQLAESPVLGFNATEYALELHRYVQVAREKLPDSMVFDFSPLETSIAMFYTASVAFDAYASQISSLFHNTDSNSRSISQNIHQLAQETSHKYKTVERIFCHGNVQPGRVNHRHVIYPRSSWHMDYDALHHLIDNFRARNWSAASEWRDIIGSKIEDAATLLTL